MKLHMKTGKLGLEGRMREREVAGFGPVSLKGGTFYERQRDRGR